MSIESSTVQSHKAVAGVDHRSNKKAPKADAIGGDAAGGFSMLMSFLASTDTPSDSALPGTEAQLLPTMPSVGDPNLSGLPAQANLGVGVDAGKALVENKPSAQTDHALGASEFIASLNLSAHYQGTSTARAATSPFNSQGVMSEENISDEILPSAQMAKAQSATEMVASQISQWSTRLTAAPLLNQVSTSSKEVPVPAQMSKAQAATENIASQVSLKTARLGATEPLSQPGKTFVEIQVPAVVSKAQDATETIASQVSLKTARPGATEPLSQPGKTFVEIQVPALVSKAQAATETIASQVSLKTARLGATEPLNQSGKTLVEIQVPAVASKAQDATETIASQVSLKTARPGATEPLSQPGKTPVEIQVPAQMSKAQAATENIASQVSLKTARLGATEPLGQPGKTSVEIQVPAFVSKAQAATESIASQVSLKTAHLGATEPLGQPGKTFEEIQVPALVSKAQAAPEIVSSQGAPQRMRVDAAALTFDAHQNSVENVPPALSNKPQGAIEISGLSGLTAESAAGKLTIRPGSAPASGSATATGVSALAAVLTPAVPAVAEPLDASLRPGQGKGPVAAPVSALAADAKEGRTKFFAEMATQPEGSAAATTRAQSEGLITAPERTENRPTAGRSTPGADGSFGSLGASSSQTVSLEQVNAPSETVAQASIAETVSHWVTQGVQNAELVVDGLGGSAVEVSISLNGEQAQVSFRTDQADVRQALEAASAQLKDLLSSQGLQLSGFSVGTSAGKEPQAEARQPNVPTAQTQAGGDEPASAPVRRSLNPAVGQSLDLFV